MSNWRNDELWLVINENPLLAKRMNLWSDDLLRRFPHVKVRSSRSIETPVLIQLSGRGSYLPVMEWYNNHRVNLLRMMDEIEARVLKLVPKEGKALEQRLAMSEKRHALFRELSPFMQDPDCLRALDRAAGMKFETGKELINNWLLCLDAANENS